MNVLVDTSVWVRHFKQRDERLVALLEAGQVVCHPCVVVEVACGTPPRRSEIIDMLAELRSVPVATPGELLDLGQAAGGRCHGAGSGVPTGPQLIGRRRLVPHLIAKRRPVHPRAWQAA